MIQSAHQRRIAIIGTGFSGLCLGYHLKKSGIESFTLFEKADRIGGTWRENTYPGVECDVPSALYSFSFERNPRWSHKWSKQPEILRYIDHCCEKFGLGPLWTRAGICATARSPTTGSGALRNTENEPAAWKPGSMSSHNVLLSFATI